MVLRFLSQPVKKQQRSVHRRRITGSTSLGKQHLDPLFGFLRALQLSERVVAFLTKSPDLLVCLGEFCVGLVPLLFRCNPRPFGGGNGIFQASDLCA